MYCQMMERAVRERKGEAVASDRRATLNLGQDLRIPPEYIENENLRLRIYKRIASVTSENQAAEVRRELEDRFGPLPSGVLGLLDYAVLKAEAERLAVATADRRGDQIAIKFHEDTTLGPERLVKLIGKRRDLRLDPAGVLWLTWKIGKDGKGGPLEAVRNVLKQLQS
jgi:transcription-repair coupling factor (superfamily II helicase)